MPCMRCTLFNSFCSNFEGTYCNRTERRLATTNIASVQIRSILGACRYNHRYVLFIPHPHLRTRHCPFIEIGNAYRFHSQMSCWQHLRRMSSPGIDRSSHRDRTLEIKYQNFHHRVHAYQLAACIDYWVRRPLLLWDGRMYS